MKFIQRKVYQLTPSVRALVALGDDGNIWLRFLCPSDNAKEIESHECSPLIMREHSPELIAEFFPIFEDMGQAKEVTA